MIDATREKVREHLDNLGAHNDPERPLTFAAAFDGNFKVSAEVPLLELTGLAFGKFELTAPAPVASSADELERFGQELCRNVRLLEQLTVIEVDPRGPTALMRSNPPRQHGEQLYYYELRLRIEQPEQSDSDADSAPGPKQRGTTRLELLRYRRAAPKDPPVQIAAEVTREMFADLTAGFINAFTARLSTVNRLAAAQ